MPPAALISSTANCFAWLATVPYVSPGPVSDSMTPIRNVSSSSPSHAMNPNAATNSAVSRRNDLTENVFILASSSHVACAHPGCRDSSSVPPSGGHSMPLSTTLFNKSPQSDCVTSETRTDCMFSCVLCCLALGEMVQSHLSLLTILRASTSHTQFVVGRSCAALRVISWAKGPASSIALTWLRRQSPQEKTKIAVTEELT